MQHGCARMAHRIAEMRQKLGRVAALTQRFHHAGAMAQVRDGAVRDRKVIGSTGLPTFCRGVTPAGPFKNGPGVIGQPSTIG